VSHDESSPALICNVRGNGRTRSAASAAPALDGCATAANIALLKSSAEQHNQRIVLGCKRSVDNVQVVEGLDDMSQHESI